MNEESGFLAAIYAAPADDAPRLKYAQWLKEKNDPLGTIIEMSCEYEVLARQDPPGPIQLDNAIGDMLEADPGRFLKPFEKLGVTFTGYVRGFAEIVEMSASDLPGSADRLHELAPLLRVLKLKNAGGHLTTIAAHPLFDRVQELHFDHAEPEGKDRYEPEGKARVRKRARIKAEDLRGLAASPRAKNLRLLQSNHCPVELGGFARAKTSHLDALQTLYLRDCDVDDAALAEFAQAKLPALESLSLDSNPLGAQGVAAFAKSTGFPALRKLNLGGNAVGDEGLQALAAAEGFPALRSLLLHEAGITGKGWQALVASPLFAQLEELLLSGNPLGDGPEAAFAKFPRAPRLKALNLAGCELGNRLPRALAEHGDFPHLKELELGNNARLTDEAVEALAAAKWLPHVESLGLQATGIRSPGVIALANSPQVRKLKSLTLGYQEKPRNLDDTAYLALAASTALASLEELEVAANTIGKPAIEAFIAATGLPSLKRLDIRLVRMTKKQATALEQRFPEVVIEIP